MPSHFQLSGPCPARPLSTPLPYLAPTDGPWVLALWCQNVTPISPLLPSAWLGLMAALAPRALGRDQADDSSSPSPQDQYHFCYDVALEYLEGLESR